METNKKLQDLTINELSLILMKTKHILIQLENENLKDDIVLNIAKILNTNNEDMLLVDLSNKGENNRPNDEMGNGTINILDIKKSKLIFVDATNVQNQEQALFRFSTLTNNIHGIFITNKNLIDDNILYKNPAYHTIKSCIKISINSNGDVKLNSYLEFPNIETNEEDTIEERPFI